MVYVSLRKHCVLLPLLPLLDRADGKAKLGRPRQRQTLLEGHAGRTAVSMEDKNISRCASIRKTF